MTLIPLITLLLTLASSASRAQCQPNSWGYQPNIPGSELNASDYDWLKDEKFSKPKYALDLSNIKTKGDMRIIASAYWDVLKIGLRAPYPPYSKAVETLFKSTSTERGFEILIDKKLAPHWRVTAVCFKDWTIASDDQLTVTAEYQRKPEFMPYKLSFIRTKERWLFDKVD
jgi:hypothetical protein